MNFRFSLFSLLVLFSTSGIFADDTTANDNGDNQTQSARINKTAVVQTVLGALTLAGQLYYLGQICKDVNGKAEWVNSYKKAFGTRCHDGYWPNAKGLFYGWLLPISSAYNLYQGINNLRS